MQGRAAAANCDDTMGQGLLRSCRRKDGLTEEAVPEAGQLSPDQRLNGGRVDVEVCWSWRAKYQFFTHEPHVWFALGDVKIYTFRL